MYLVCTNLFKVNIKLRSFPISTHSGHGRIVSAHQSIVPVWLLLFFFPLDVLGIVSVAPLSANSAKQLWL